VAASHWHLLPCWSLNLTPPVSWWDYSLWVHPTQALPIFHTFPLLRCRYEGHTYCLSRHCTGRAATISCFRYVHIYFIWGLYNQSSNRALNHRGQHRYWFACHLDVSFSFGIVHLSRGAGRVPPESVGWFKSNDSVPILHSVECSEIFWTFCLLISDRTFRQSTQLLGCLCVFVLLTCPLSSNCAGVLGGIFQGQISVGNRSLLSTFRWLPLL